MDLVDVKLPQLVLVHVHGQVATIVVFFRDLAGREQFLRKSSVELCGANKEIV